MKTDAVQKIIIPHLAETESLINQICKDLSGKTGNAKIIAMEDLCIPDNIVRMRGGFFTGTYIKWKCEVPFIPIDATVNSCGVSIFKITNKIPIIDFQKIVMSIVKNSLFDNWNFDRGNHFISLCIDDDNNTYIVIHASDSKYKFGNLGLYPYNNPWYENEIITLKNKDRFIRYIKEKTAEYFFELYKQSEHENPIRNRMVCEEIIGKNNIIDELYCPHYGMPTKNSIAIGCQWKKGTKIMLSAPGKDIYIFKGNDRLLYPHGFGMIPQNFESIKYLNGQIQINGKTLEGEDSFIIKGNLKTRFEDQVVNKETIKLFLDGKKFDSVNVLHQLAAFTRTGFSDYHFNTINIYKE